jgi:hypothetical protein
VVVEEGDFGVKLIQLAQDEVELNSVCHKNKDLHGQLNYYQVFKGYLAPLFQ